MNDYASTLLEWFRTAALLWLVWKQLRPGRVVPGTLAWIHQDLAGMRDALRKDSGEIRRAAEMLERRVAVLEDADGMHRRALVEFGETLKGLDAQVKAIHSEVRVLNAHSVTALRAMETMLAVKQSLERIELRLPGPA